MRAGIRLETTLTTPELPQPANASVSESSPERIVIEQRWRISLAESIEPVASLIATMFG